MQKELMIWIMKQVNANKKCETYKAERNKLLTTQKGVEMNKLDLWKNDEQTIKQNIIIC